LPELRHLEDGSLAQGHDIEWSILLNHEQLRTQQKWLRAVEPIEASFFFYLIDLTLIAQAFTNQLYRTDVLQKGSAEIESCITHCSKKMDQWVSGLHPYFAFERIFIVQQEELDHRIKFHWRFTITALVSSLIAHVSLDLELTRKVEPDWRAHVLPTTPPWPASVRPWHY
jgi:hypothetical protein